MASATNTFNIDENDQQFCLRWKTFPSSLSSQFKTLKDDEDFVDVTIACAGSLLGAHKLVLSACSPYFKQIFKSNPCPHPVLLMLDTEAKQIKSLLQFVYCGEVDISRSDLPQFLRIAENLQIRGLADKNKETTSQPAVISNPVLVTPQKEPSQASEIEDTHSVDEPVEDVPITFPSVSKNIINKTTSVSSNTVTNRNQETNKEENIEPCYDDVSATMIQPKIEDETDEVMMTDDNMEDNSLVNFSDSLMQASGVEITDSIIIEELEYRENEKTSDKNSECLDSEQDDVFVSRFTEEHEKALAMSIAMKVSKEVVETQQLWTAALEYAHKMQNMKPTEDTSRVFEIPAHFLHGGDGMVEITPKCGFFLPKDKVTYIERMARTASTAGVSDNDWTLVVREVLQFVYGNELKGYSATGLRSKRPPLNRKLVCGLLDWCNRLCKFQVDKKIYIQYINKCCSNRRYSNNKKLISYK